MNGAMQELHDKATRSIQLSLEEKTLLEKWYAEQDTQEHELLGLSRLPLSLHGLQAQIDEALAEVDVAIKHIQELTIQNETLRRNNRALRQLLEQ